MDKESIKIGMVVSFLTATFGRLRGTVKALKVDGSVYVESGHKTFLVHCSDIELDSQFDNPSVVRNQEDPDLSDKFVSLMYNPDDPNTPYLDLIVNCYNYLTNIRNILPEKDQEQAKKDVNRRLKGLFIAINGKITEQEAMDWFTAKCLHVERTNALKEQQDELKDNTYNIRLSFPVDRREFGGR